MTTTEPDRLLAFPGDDVEVQVRIVHDCRDCDWDVRATGTDETRVGEAADRAVATHLTRCHEGHVGYVVVVDSSDSPLPRHIGPFRRHDAATRWMETEVGAGTASWTVVPLTVPTPHDDKPVSG